MLISHLILLDVVDYEELEDERSSNKISKKIPIKCVSGTRINK